MYKYTQAADGSLISANGKRKQASKEAEAKVA